MNLEYKNFNDKEVISELKEFILKKQGENSQSISKYTVQMKFYNLIGNLT